MSDLATLQARLGYDFRNKELLRRALTHPSLATDLGSETQHNQRLEFLGDAVLQLVLTRELYDKFPTLGEGPLTKARAQMVNGKSLARIAHRLHLGPELLMSRGEVSSGGREKASALSDALEALVGAVYLDGGLTAARACVLRIFNEEFGQLEVVPSLDNPKGELQELIQARHTGPPVYELQSVRGPDHERIFEVAVFHDGVELGRGTGHNKKAAESQAAQAALASLRERTCG